MRHQVEPLRDVEAVRVLGGVRHLVEVLRLEGDEHALLGRAHWRRPARNASARRRRRGRRRISCWKRRRIAEPPERNISTLMPVSFWNSVDDLLALVDRRRGVPDHLAFGLRLGDVDGVLGVGGGEQREQRERAKRSGEVSCGVSLFLVVVCRLVRRSFRARAQLASPESIATELAAFNARCVTATATHGFRVAPSARPE